MENKTHSAPQTHTTHHSIPSYRDEQGREVYRPWDKMWATMVHILTASGAFVGLLSLEAIVYQKWTQTFLLMSLAMFIDAVDGYFARKFRVSKVVEGIDGALLDNMVDYFNYTLVPSFFLMNSTLVSYPVSYFLSFFITMSSAYQFIQKDAKTPDHFFKGFPSYWNIVVFYLYLFNFSEVVNSSVILFLCAMSFVPVKYIYPSRMQYTAKRKEGIWALQLLTLLWAISGLALIITYPTPPTYLIAYTLIYWIIYLGVSVYRTFYPLPLLPEDS